MYMLSFWWNIQALQLSHLTPTVQNGHLHIRHFSPSFDLHWIPCPWFSLAFELKISVWKTQSKRPSFRCYHVKMVQNSYFHSLQCKALNCLDWLKNGPRFTEELGQPLSLLGKRTECVMKPGEFHMLFRFIGNTFHGPRPDWMLIQTEWVGVAKNALILTACWVGKGLDAQVLYKGHDFSA